jgi:lipoprotein signal peptidase
VATIAYVGVAYGMFSDQEWWRTALAGVTVFSLALTILGWRDTIVGTVFNIVVLVALLVG